MRRSEAIPKTAKRRSGDGSHRTRTESARSLAFPFAVSTALHGLAAIMIAILAAGGASSEAPLPASTIRATLKSAAPQFVVPEPEPPATAPLPASPVHPTTESAVVPVPLTPRATPRDKPSPQGQVIVGALGIREPVDRAVEAAVKYMHAGAVRSEVEFETPPIGVYPQAALSERRQFQINVAVVVHEDGRVELAQGTFDDTLFAPAIRATLATAKARPLEVNGQVRTSWSLVSFTFEYVDVR